MPQWLGWVLRLAHPGRGIFVLMASLVAFTERDDQTAAILGGGIVVPIKGATLRLRRGLTSALL
jgi:hypothetical protein